MDRNKELKVHRLRLPGRSLCSIRSNRKWCKRRGSSLQCQNCFFVYPIIDSNLKNLLYIYDLKINSEEFGKYPANKTQTIQDQKEQGRRPHVSLQQLFVDAQNLEPDIIFDIRRCKAYNRLSEYYQKLLGK